MRSQHTDPATGLFEALVGALALWLKHVGVPVAAHVLTRGLDDHLVVFMAKPWEASEAARRSFAEEACQGYDSAGQFSPGWTELFYGEEAEAIAVDADADPGFSVDDSGVVQREWCSGATRF